METPQLEIKNLSVTVDKKEILRELTTHPEPREAAIARGWEAGLQLLIRMAANSRYFTDSASKIPHDVAQGNAAAGMCIDFYGRSYAADLRTAFRSGGDGAAIADGDRDAFLTFLRERFAQ